MIESGFQLEEFFSSTAMTTWRRVSAKRFLREIDVRSDTGKEELLGLSGRRGVVRRSDIDQRASEANSYVGYKKVEAGNLVSNKMQAWNGVFGISRFDGITSPDYAVYRFTDNTESRFIEYSLRTKLFAEEFRCRSKGIGTGFLRLNPSQFLSTVLYLPDGHTQRAVADFLDRETSRIDDLIEKKRRLLELADEKRATLITAAVTGKGGPETGPYRVNEPEGNVVTTWPEYRLKHLVRLVVDQATSHKGNGPYVGLEAIASWTGVIDPAANDLEGGSLGNRFRPGDVLFGKLRPYLAKVAAPAFSGHCSGEALVLRPLVGTSPRFLRYRMAEAGTIDAVDASTYGAKMPRASWEFIGNLKFQVPSLDAQKAIADFLDRETGRIDDLKAKTLASIDRLHEYRTALITAAVTGQIDVTAKTSLVTIERRVEAIQVGAPA